MKGHFSKSNRLKSNRSSFLITIFSALLFGTGCQQGNKQLTKEELRKKLDKKESPVLAPSETLKHFVLEKNFQIQLAASEPLVSAPVASSFDNQGRLWVVEMNAYMPDTSGNGEQEPVGKIVILEDKNHDGVFDDRKVFMDSLVMPRALCLFDDGILVAEPPKLWFVEKNGDKAGQKFLVDSDYAKGGNTEHQPNGLLRGLDNWIYNAKSANRYRRVGKNKWLKEHTHFRGQWGISQDEFGRLYYNNNSFNLLGDYFSPSLGANNPHQARVAGFDEGIVSDNSVFPIHPTPGVNRGYLKDVLDDSLRLINFTAACAPLVFNSPAFGKEYYNNVFVAEPAGNLIKRDVLTFHPDSTTGKEAYHDKEFLASDDERFRPVNLYVGPDGALYVLDMYRGIIQHKTYLTPYLASEAIARGLETPLNCGRIYKVTKKGTSLTTPSFNENNDSLLSYLNSSNQWLRETAHNYIFDKQLKNLASSLRKMLKTDTNLIGKINAMWALEGLGGISNKDLEEIWPSSSFEMQQQILTCAIAIMHSKKDADFWLPKYDAMLQQNVPGTAPYLAYLGAAIIRYTPQGNDLLMKILNQFPGNPFVADAVISGLHDKEKPFLLFYQQTVKDTADFFAKRLQAVIQNAEKQRLAAIASKKLDKDMLAGLKLFQQNCKVCHGDDGEGIKGLGAPLNGSNWVLGDKNKVISIVLYGLTGPIKVGDKMYAPPDVSEAMPAMASNESLGDKEIADIISYIRNAWNNKASKATEEEVKNIRQKYHGRQEPFTMKELMK
ncbi:dehydrogenase [Hanamia caeni]|jgi:mono/diheme cytochrome c family protein/glucose/arabinose dehydrogenase|uniref:Dehydrogenase n=1 Tax=Hanamia caeni TaxID=2294116 RepID=A0A3M9N6S5_9BACT|nr:c-type cytochrome [Hanamia caeni]RNI33502.1 dehydrogenase [Hanamia caeni]